MNMEKTIEALEGARFVFEDEDLGRAYFTTHVVAKGTEHVSVLMSFSTGKEDEAAELDVFLSELVSGRYTPL